jgi:hypothetical protein
MSDLVDRIQTFLEANPYHDTSGQFVDKDDMKAGSFSIGGKRRTVRRSKKGVKKKLTHIDCGRAGRGKGSDIRCWDAKKKDP